MFKDYKDQVVTPVITDKFSGFYLGASLGANGNFFRFHDDLANNINLGADTPLLQAFGGYGQLMPNNFYLGGEIYLNNTISSARANTQLIDGGGVGTHVNIQTRYSYGASFLPGVLLTQDVVGYGRIGPVWTQFYTNVQSPTAQYTNNNRQLGAELGAGLLVALTYNVDVRLDYSHSIYKSYHTTVNAYHIAPTSDRTNLGIVYNFA